MDNCPHHEAIQCMVDIGERDRTELWNAVTELRKDIKAMLGKIGLIVGTITAINSIVIVLVQVAIKKPG